MKKLRVLGIKFEFDVNIQIRIFIRGCLYMINVGTLEVYGVIYKITNKINGKSYIGQTIRGFDNRYKYNLRKNTHNQYLREEIEDYGIDNFAINKNFDYAFSKNELDIKEKAYIRLYKTNNPKYGYNCTDGGHDCKFNQEYKNKLSTVKYGANNPMFGTSHTEHTIELMSEKKIGRNNPRSRKVKCVTTGEVFDTVLEAEKKYGADHSAIAKVCRGKNRFCGRLTDGTKLIWEYD